jgi:putative endonuclease
VGITTDVKRRVEEHNSSLLGARYTRGRRPVQVVYSKAHISRSEATKEERRIKKLTRSQKRELLASQEEKQLI